MLSEESRQAYRNMSMGQRLQLTMAANEEHEPFLLKGRPEVVARRFALLHRENGLRNANMLKAFAATKAQG